MSSGTTMSPEDAVLTALSTEGAADIVHIVVGTRLPADVVTQAIRALVDRRIVIEQTLPNSPRPFYSLRRPVRESWF